jgi:hypothetical protein
MSKQASVTAEQLGPEEKDLFEKYRNGSISPDEEIELFEMLSSLKETHGKNFKLRNLTQALSYTQFDIKRLDSEWLKWRRRQERETGMPPEGPQQLRTSTLAGKGQEISVGAAKTMFKEIQEIGNFLVSQCTVNAANRGESLKEYVQKSIELREQYGDQIEALSQENDSLKALCKIFVEAVKPQFRQIAAARMYLDWITGLIQLQAVGVPVNGDFVDNITNRLEQALQVKLT